MSYRRMGHDLAKRAVKKAALKLLKKAGSKLVAVLIGTLGLPLIIFLIAVVLALFLFAAVYAAMPGDQHLTGVKPSQADAAIREYVRKQVAAMNVKETWLVPGEGRWHPGKGKYTFGRLVDRYGQDTKLVNEWGDAYAPVLYRALQTADKDRMADRAWVEAKARKAAKALRPWFYYKESKVTYCGKDGCESETVYLLVEAYTIRGHNLYRYRWVTKTYGDGGSVTYEEPAGTETLDNGRKYLETYLSKALGLPPGSTDIELAGDMVFNAGIAFTQARKEWLAWLDHAFGATYAWASGAGVPAEFRTFLEEAEKLTGIPAWFLAGLIQKESDWNPLAVNDRTGCFGLTQQHPDYWPERARAAGFDPEQDKWNPRAQIVVGAVYLASLLDVRNVDWEGGGWKNDPRLQAAMARYGGYGTDVAAAKGYIGKVVAAAQGYRTPAVWPVTGTGPENITSHFGMRFHPTLHIWRGHNGIDIAAREDTPVVSVSGGIAYVGYDDESGNYVVVKDGTYEYVYCHLSRVLTVSGQAVKPGDQIGLVGSTGASTGPHLHFGVKKLNTNSWIDPLLVLIGTGGG